MREKLNSKVLFDEDSWTRFQAEVPKVCIHLQYKLAVDLYFWFVFIFWFTQMKLVTPSALVERLKINVSLARAACKLMAAEGKLNVVESHNKQQIYTRVSA